MSPYGHVITIYRARVVIPGDVMDRFGHTLDYQSARDFASDFSKYDSSAVSESPVEGIEYLESLNQKDCTEFINRWHNQILRWQEQMRSES